MDDKEESQAAIAASEIHGWFSAQETRSLTRTESMSKTIDLSRVYGKIQIVDHLADFKVQIVDHFADLNVQLVDHFASSPGKWQIVKHFADYKIQIVKHFPDFKIKYVKHFPGVK